MSDGGLHREADRRRRRSRSSCSGLMASGVEELPRKCIDMRIVRFHAGNPPQWEEDAGFQDRTTARSQHHRLSAFSCRHRGRTACRVSPVRCGAQMCELTAPRRQSGTPHFVLASAALPDSQRSTARLLNGNTSSLVKIRQRFRPLLNLRCNKDYACRTAAELPALTLLEGFAKQTEGTNPQPHIKVPTAA